MPTKRSLGRPVLRGWAIVALMLLSFMGGSFGSEDASAELNIDTALSYKQYTPNNSTGTEEWTEAQVGPGYSGVVKFNGKLVIQRWPGSKAREILVDLKAHLEEADNVEPYDDPGLQSWGTSVYPNDFIFYPWEFDRLGAVDGVERDFEVTARAPVRVDAKAVKMVVVTGDWLAIPASETLNSGVVVESWIELNVAQYFDIIMDSITPLKTVWPGGEARFTLIVNNHGNGKDEFTISLDNEKFLTRNGWAVLIPETKVEVEAHSEGRFDIIVQSPNEFISMYKNEIREVGIRVESKNALTNNDEEWEVYYVFVHEQGFNFLYNDPMLIIFFFVIIILMGYAWRTSGRRQKERIERLKVKRLARRDPRTGEWKKGGSPSGRFSWKAIKQREEAEEEKYAKIREVNRVDDDYEEEAEEVGDEDANDDSGAGDEGGEMDGNDAGDGETGDREA
jgi:hypothetical protein